MFHAPKHYLQCNKEIKKVDLKNKIHYFYVYSCFSYDDLRKTDIIIPT